VPIWLLYLLLGLAGLVLLWAAVSVWAIHHYMPDIMRIVEDLPLYTPAIDEPPNEGQSAHFQTLDGLRLHGRYLPTHTGSRRGVVVFSHEFGTNGDSATRYAGFLLDRGFDLFTFDYRGHGTSPCSDDYEPRQWPSDKEFADLSAAVDYVMSRPDAPDRVGLMGISRGGGTVIAVAGADPRVGAVVTDGAFAPRGTVAAYVQRWGEIYIRPPIVGRNLPMWFAQAVYYFVKVEARRRFHCKFPSVDRAVRRIAPRPLLMIHGQNDTYIPLALSQKLFAKAGEPKQHWAVPMARHNKCYLAGQDEYADRVTGLFAEALSPAGHAAADLDGVPEPSRSAAEAG